MCTDNHFHLLVGNVKVGRWEYYNSLNNVGDVQFLEYFVSIDFISSTKIQAHICGYLIVTHVLFQTTFVASRLRDNGWPNPLSWRLVSIPNLPQQANW